MSSLYNKARDLTYMLIIDMKREEVEAALKKFDAASVTEIFYRGDKALEMYILELQKIK